MYIKSFTWVYCICHYLTSVTTLGCTSGASIGVYCICHQVYCRGHHLTSGTTLGCSSRASLGCTAFAIVYCKGHHLALGATLGCTSGASQVYCICHKVVCISYHVNQEPHMVYCISQQVYWICHHVHQKLHLGVLHLPSSNIRNNTGVHFRSLTWVYWICRQVYCRGHHLASGTTLRCTLGASLRCATFAIKWSAYPIM